MSPTAAPPVSIPRMNPRFTITQQGTPAMIQIRKHQEFLDALRLTRTHETAALVARQCEDGAHWEIFGEVEDPRSDHGEVAKEELSDWLFDDEQEALQYIDENEQSLRDELAETFFTEAECHRCDAAVPVLGEYTPYAPAGVLICESCLIDDDEFYDGGPAIIRD